MTTRDQIVQMMLRGAPVVGSYGASPRRDLPVPGFSDMTSKSDEELRQEQELAERTQRYYDYQGLMNTMRHAP